MIVSYFSESLQRVLVHHYNLKSFNVVNTANLFDHVKATLRKDIIPFSNLVSNLSDSTNHMRGKVSVLETLLRKEVLLLLNINRDICHHTHNAVNSQTHLENISSSSSDIRKDSQRSPDL